MYISEYQKVCVNRDEKKKTKQKMIGNEAYYYVFGLYDGRKLKRIPGKRYYTNDNL